METAKFLQAVLVNNAVVAGELTFGAVGKNDAGLKGGGEEVAGQPVGELAAPETNRRGQCATGWVISGDIPAASGCTVGGDSSGGPEADDGGGHGK